MVAIFLRCAMVTHWLHYTLVKKMSFFGGLESLILSLLFEYTN